MAKQKGIVKLKGTIGDLSFYKTKDGHMAREKGGVDKKRIATDPAFQRTRENGMEFGRAGKAGKTLRVALRQYLQVAADSRVTSRLTSEMMQIIKTDAVNDRGLRKVQAGDLSLLNGFDFNLGGKLNTTLFAPYDHVIDRAGGSATVSLASFVPGKDVEYPLGSTHMKLIAGLAEIDFANEKSAFAAASSGELEVGSMEVGPINLEMNFTPNSNRDLFLVLGVEFMQDVNGKHYTLNNGAFNALAVIEVSQLV